MKQFSNSVLTDNPQGLKSLNPDAGDTGLNNNSSKAYNNFGKPPEKSEDFSTLLTVPDPLNADWFILSSTPQIVEAVQKIGYTAYLTENIKNVPPEDIEGHVAYLSLKSEVSAEDLLKILPELKLHCSRVNVLYDDGFLSLADKTKVNKITGITIADILATSRSLWEKKPDNADDWTIDSVSKNLFPRIPFPWDVLPCDLTHSIKSLARSMATNANPLPGILFSMIGGAIGRNYAVTPKKNWIEPLIFWAIDIRDSGEGKSPAMWSLADVLVRNQSDANDYHEMKFKEWKSQKPKDRGDEPPPPRGYFITELTLEGLRTDLNYHPTGGVVVMLDEASALISGQNQYKNKGTDREAWLKLYDGKPARIARAGSSIMIKDARVQIVGGIQPEIFIDTFGGENGKYLSDGTVFRCLFTHLPPCHYELTREDWGDSNRETWNHILKLVYNWGDNAEPIKAILDEKAQSRFIDWRNSLDNMKPQLPKIIRGFLPKAYGNTLRLAGAIDCLHQFSCGMTPRKVLDLKALERGIKTISFYLGQAISAIKILQDKNYKEDPTRIKILDALQEKPMCKTDISNNVFRRNLTSEKLTMAIEELKRSGQIIEYLEPTAGRPKVFFKLSDTVNKYPETLN